jgi:hypothetical protein
MSNTYPISTIFKPSTYQGNGNGNGEANNPQYEPYDYKSL